MKQRFFLIAIVALIAAPLAPAQTPANDDLVFVGSYTHPTLAATVTYNSGTFTVYAVAATGRLSEPFYTDQHTGKPLSPRQPGPKAHGIAFSKDTRFVYVAELGLDRVYSYHVDAAKHAVTPLNPPYVEVPAGSGPRRLQLHPNGRFLYVNHETDSKVTVF